MKLATVIAAITALALGPGTEAAAIKDKRVSYGCENAPPWCGQPLISEFTIFGGNDCHASDALANLSFYKTQDSGACIPFGASAKGKTVLSVSETAGDFKCQLTVFANGDCSDGGIPLGIPQLGAAAGCYSNPSIQAYKIQCPWWTS